MQIGPPRLAKYQLEDHNITLRDYQLDALEQIKDKFNQKNEWVILSAPTGSGKTLTSGELIRKTIANKKRVLFVVDRIALVQQTIDAFNSMGIPCGVEQASNTRSTDAPCVVGSVQTYARRGLPVGFDLVIIDECHTQHKKLIKTLEHESKLRLDNGEPRLFVVGLTATPMSKGLGTVYDDFVTLATTDQLLARGVLAPLKVYAAKAEIDMSDADVNSEGEWTAEDVSMRTLPVLGDIVDEWERYTNLWFGGPVKTLLFSADIPAGEKLQEAFKQRGYDFVQCTHEDDGKKTQQIINQFKNGDFIGLISVEKFTKGFDVPDVQCIIGARPYRTSLTSFIQQVGRGMRSYLGKKFCLYLDHGGNCYRFRDEWLDFNHHGVTQLDMGSRQKKKKKKLPEREDRVCGHCNALLYPKEDKCRECGTPVPKRVRQTRHETVNAEMVEFDTDYKEDSASIWNSKGLVYQHIYEHAYRFVYKNVLDDMIRHDKARKFTSQKYHKIYNEWPGNFGYKRVYPINAHIKKWLANDYKQYKQQIGKQT